MSLLVKNKLYFMQKFDNFWTTFFAIKILLKHSFKQHANKIMSDSPWLGLVDFGLRLVNSVFTFLTCRWVVNFLENSNHRRTVIRALQQFSLGFRCMHLKWLLGYYMLSPCATVKLCDCKIDFFASCLNKIYVFFPGMPHQPKLHWWRNSRRIWTIPPSCTRDGQLLHQIAPLIIRRRT